MTTDNKQKNDSVYKRQDWLNNHGQPSREYLQSLVDDGDPTSFQKLRSIAQDLDLNFDPNISSQELIDAILKAVEDVPDRFTP